MRINLLPPEVRRRQRTRRQVALVVVVGVVILALLGVLFLFQQLKLNGLRRDLAAQEQVNEDLRRQIAELSEFDQLQRELAASEQLFSQLMADEVRWSAVLRDISLVIPGDVWLDSLDASLQTAAEGETGTVTQGLIGQISMSGFGLSHRSVALWLTRLEDVQGFVNPWASNSQQTRIGESEAVQFSSTVDLAELIRFRQGGETP